MECSKEGEEKVMLIKAVLSVCFEIMALHGRENK
jgi:hypothetical protein